MINEELIKKVAKMARLELTSNELSQFTKDFKNILEAFSDLDKVKVDAVKSSFHPADIKNVVREDIVVKGLDVNIALNVKNKERNYFKGPRTV